MVAGSVATTLAGLGSTLAHSVLKRSASFFAAAAPVELWQDSIYLLASDVGTARRYRNGNLYPDDYSSPFDRVPSGGRKPREQQTGLLCFLSEPSTTPCSPSGSW